MFYRLSKQFGKPICVPDLFDRFEAAGGRIGRHAGAERGHGLQQMLDCTDLQIDDIIVRRQAGLFFEDTDEMITADMAVQI